MIQRCTESQSKILDTDREEWVCGIQSQNRDDLGAALLRCWIRKVRICSFHIEAQFCKSHQQLTGSEFPVREGSCLWSTQRQRGWWWRLWWRLWDVQSFRYNTHTRQDQEPSVLQGLAQIKTAKKTRIQGENSSVGHQLKAHRLEYMEVEGRRKWWFWPHFPDPASLTDSVST